MGAQIPHPQRSRARLASAVVEWSRCQRVVVEVRPHGLLWPAGPLFARIAARQLRHDPATCKRLMEADRL